MKGFTVILGPVVCIERIDPREGIQEYPVWKDGCGFVLGDPKHGNEKHHEKNEVYSTTLDDAADHVQRGFSLRMGRFGTVGSLISPSSLRIVRAHVYGR